VELPFASLDRLALQSKLHEIGALEGATHRAKSPAPAAE
jgi:hypothetical protein